MINRIVLLSFFIALAACSDSRSMMGVPAANCGGNTLYSLEVAPAELARGEEIEIVVRAEIGIAGDSSYEVEMLSARDEAVRVLMPLTSQGGRIYEARVQNPFGLGVSSGEIVVRLISVSGSDCIGAAIGATSFLLN